MESDGGLFRHVSLLPLFLHQNILSPAEFEQLCHTRVLRDAPAAQPGAEYRAWGR